MNIHKNARLTQLRREKMALMVKRAGLAAAIRVPDQTG